MKLGAWIGALIALAVLIAAPLYGIDNSVQSAPSNSPYGGSTYGDSTYGGSTYGGSTYGGSYARPSAESSSADKEIEARRAELTEWEAKLRKDEERISAMRRDLDEQIDKYTKLLIRIEAALQSAGDINDKNTKKIVKSYEAMQPEEAAVRLAALPDNLAVNILLGMNPRKSGTALAVMPPQKVAVLTERMSSVLKNLPAAAAAISKKPGTP